MDKLIKKYILKVSERDITINELDDETSLNALGFDSMKYLIMLYKLCENLELDMMELDPNEISKIDKLCELRSFLEKEAPNFHSN